MNNKNNIGPKTEPWGTPLITGFSTDKQFSITTRCERLIKNADSHDSNLPQIPKDSNLTIDFLKTMLSNARLKST
jgi:hypothetical protein